jgi:hypothetical protein
VTPGKRVRGKERTVAAAERVDNLFCFYLNISLISEDSTKTAMHSSENGYVVDMYRRLGGSYFLKT